MDNTKFEGGEAAAMEQVAAPQKACCTCLVVLGSQDDDVQPFEKILQDFKQLPEENNGQRFTIKHTTYEEFLEGTKVDTFDFVILAFLSDVSSDDLEMKEDYYDYYSMVPLVHYGVSKSVKESEDFAGVKTYLKEKYDKRLFQGEPLVFDADAAKNLCNDLESLHNRKDKIFDESVRKAFDKFDKDGNGTIDAKELQQLSSELGHDLNDEQLEEALKDLDLNGDGVIDTEEFSRWYFTGMKSYNGATRSMLQMRNQTVTIFDLLAKDDIQKILKEDKSMTKHRIQIKFNEPPESYYGEMIYHLLGPFTEKMNEQCEAFCKEVNLQELPGAKTAKIFFTVSIAMKPGNKAKYEEFCSKLMALYQEHKPKPSSYVPDMQLKLEAADDKITAKFMLVLPEAINPLNKMQIPVGLKEGLKDVDQFVKVKVVMGADAEEILSQDKPLIEHYLKGFSFTVDVVFLKQIKKALLTGLEGTQIGKDIKDGLNMAGPAFALQSNLSIQLDFDDMEEIKAHPMASTVLVSLDQLLQTLTGSSKEQIKEWTPKYEVDDKAEFDKFVETSDYCKEKKMQIDLFQQIGEIISCIDQDCNLEIRGSIMGLGSLEYNIQGSGYGELINLIYKAATKGVQESLISRMQRDYTDSKEGPKDEEGEKPAEEAEMM